jgi:hypothetical protein
MQQGRDVDHWHTLDVQRGDNLKQAQDRLDFAGDLRLERPHYDVLTAFFSPPCLVEHAK